MCVFFLFKYSPFSNSFGLATECGNNDGKLTILTNCLRNSLEFLFSSSPNKLTEKLYCLSWKFYGVQEFLWPVISSLAFLSKNGTYLNDKFWKLKLFSSIYDSNQRNEKLFRWLASLWVNISSLYLTYSSQWFIPLFHLFQTHRKCFTPNQFIDLLSSQNIVVWVFFDNSLFKSPLLTWKSFFSFKIGKFFE